MQATFPNQPNTPIFRHSPSVDSALSPLYSAGNITSWRIVQAILQIHPDYAGLNQNTLAGLTGPVGGVEKPLETWLQDLYQLFDPSKVDEIHSRIAIIGMGCLDDGLHAYLTEQKILAKLEQQLKEPFDSLLLEHKRKPYLAPTAGYLSDTVNKLSPDRLNIDREVANIATVLCSKRVSPPISIGLFGDWGSGKSFFMTKLKKRIDDITEYFRNEDAKGVEASNEWCSRIVQIEFNAWHFSDANLWASLVSGIYEGLFDELDDTKESDKHLKEKLQTGALQAKGVEAEANAQLEKASAQVEKAKSDLMKTQDEVAKSTKNLKDQIGKLFVKDEETKKSLNDAAEALGITDALETYDALKAFNADLKSFASRFNSLILFLWKSKKTLLLVVFLILTLPFLIPYLLDYFSIQISAIAKQITTFSTIVLGFTAWAKKQVGEWSKNLATIEKAAREAEAIQQNALEEDEAVRKANSMLALAKSEAAAAQDQFNVAQAKRLQLENELKELRPERKLFRLIEERSQSEAYSKYLGIISLIRQDFEKMSALLGDLKGESRKSPEDPAPIQRIILYIDDLDRCRPDRVIEVLEAVHLLLAFPLFIVVVGVDPRWLRHSLAEHYPTTLYDQSSSVTQDEKGNLAFYATPQDYLEKIFQIPFALRPVEKDGFVQLVGDLLQPLPAVEVSGGSVDAPTPTPPIDTSGGADLEGINGKGAGHALDPRFTPPSNEQLEFEAWEKRDIEQLWPLFQTPRTIKRFINIYRILRAGLGSKEDVKLFTGTDTEPGEYQIVILLLAVVTNFPNETNQFLNDIDNWLSIEDKSDLDYAWNDIIAMLKKTGIEGAIEQNSSWELMINCLERIQTAVSFRSFRKERIAFWALQTSRYSFSIRPPRSMTL